MEERGNDLSFLLFPSEWKLGVIVTVLLMPDQGYTYGY